MMRPITSLEAANTLRLLLELGDRDDDVYDEKLDADVLKIALRHAVDVLDPPVAYIERLMNEIQHLKAEVRKATLDSWRDTHNAD